MPRWGMIAAGIAVFAIVASQVLVPSLGARKVEDRLTVGGGTAEVTLGAVPAIRLLFGDGERLEVSARDLDLELDPDGAAFDRLDGFSIVDVSIAGSTAGPFELESFELRRDGDAPYRLVASGSVTPAGLAEAGLESVEVPGESVLDLILGRLFGDTTASLPIELEMELESADGRLQVVSGGGTVAGLPTGPLAQLITAAVVVRI